MGWAAAFALDFVRGSQGKSVTALVGLVYILVKVVGDFLLLDVVVRVMPVARKWVVARNAA